ncbi:MAG: hypothetical protein PCFJNLEI_02267 [Verrucomicrobiae bacterium]|nr:hypothetical protein [Verrucomicrobiae bacterium]
MAHSNVISEPVNIEQINKELATLDKQFEHARKAYEEERSAWLRIKEIALSKQHQTKLPVDPIVIDSIPRTVISSGKSNNRQAIRDFLAGWTGSFTIPQILEAAEKSNHPSSQLSQNVWSSTVFWLCQTGVLAVVEPRRGNLPGKYRVIVGQNELLTPTKKPIIRGYPLQSIVAESIKHIPQNRFGRNELTEFAVKQYPEHKERLTVDIVGAVLNRLAQHEVGVRIIERSTQGNVYERI